MALDIIAQVKHQVHPPGPQEDTAGTPAATPGGPSVIASGTQPHRIPKGAAVAPKQESQRKAEKSEPGHE